MTLKARARANSDFADPKTGIELLQEQISEAKQLLKIGLSNQWTMQFGTKQHEII